jgi:tRNA pseudouridine55 synthase
LVDKPAGMTSHDVVAIARRRLGTRSVGHTGTLDPFATGLLVLVVGSATRLARFVTGGFKRYRAEARLGLATTTDDLTGEPVGDPWLGDWPDLDRVTAALAGMEGTVPQRPPSFSAKLVEGVRSYRRARRGDAVALAEVEVTIAELRVVEYRPPTLVFEALVGAGTYLRSIARDLGEALGTGAHLTALRRERVGRFEVKNAVPPELLAADGPLIPPIDLIVEMPRLEVSEEDVDAVRHGRQVQSADAGSPITALVHRGGLVAIAEPRGGRWQPIIVLRGAA